MPPESRRLLSRLALLAALAVWQGGFTFYALVVVPVGTAVHGSALAQGAVSDKVAWRLDLLGLGVLALWAFDVFRAGSGWRPKVWVAQVALATLMLLLHVRMADHFDGTWISARRGFDVWHSAYLAAATGQWVLSVVAAWLALRAWSEADSARRGA